MPRSSMMSSGTVARQFHVLFARAVEGGVGEFLEQGVGFAIEDAIALLDGGAADGLGQVALAGAGRAKKSASSRWAMKPAVARSKTRARFIFLLKSKSKLSSVLCGSRKRGLFAAALEQAVLRRVSSSETRQEIRSMGAIGSAWAWRRRVSRTAAMPPRRSCAERAFEFDEIHCGFSLVLRSMRSR